MPCFLHCNHTSNWDPLVIMICAGYRIHQLFAMAKRRLLPGRWREDSETCRHDFVERGKADIGAIRTAMKYLKNDRPILIFPEGTRVSEDEAISAKGGLSMLSVRTTRPLCRCIWMAARNFSAAPVSCLASRITAGGGRRGTAEEYQQIADEALRRIYTLKQERKVHR